LSNPPKNAPSKIPDCSGGFEYRKVFDPNPDCPECSGEGLTDVHCADLDTLTGAERKLIQSVKQTRDGVQVTLRDQDAALSNLARYLGLLVDRRELTGKDGTPLLPEAIPLDLPKDPEALAALYARIVGAD